MSHTLLIGALVLGVTVLDPADVSEVPPRPGAPPATAMDSIRVLEEPLGQRTPAEPSPRPGEYSYVEQLPQPIKKVLPAYPKWARQKGISGTVLVQVLVGKDGLVKDTRVVRSIPELDDYAVASVKQWRFKPAMTEGKPLAIWVAIPVKFSLK